LYFPAWRLQKNVPNRNDSTSESRRKTSKVQDSKCKDHVCSDGFKNKKSRKTGTTGTSHASKVIGEQEETETSHASKVIGEQEETKTRHVSKVIGDQKEETETSHASKVIGAGIATGAIGSRGVLDQCVRSFGEWAQLTAP
jgi:hypothetical protein